MRTDDHTNAKKLLIPNDITHHTYKVKFPCNLNALVLPAVHACDVPQVLHCHVTVMSKYSSAKFKFPLDKFCTFALRSWYGCFKQKALYVSCLFYVPLTCFIKLVLIALYLVYADTVSIPSTEDISLLAFFSFRQFQNLYCYESK